MILGVLREIKENEHRVSMTPGGVEIVRQHGHKILIEDSAGNNSGYSNEDYLEVGGEISTTARDIYEKAEMIMHVKEPVPAEYDLIRPGQIIFTYLHLAADEKLTKHLVKTNSVCVGYETIQEEDGSLPLLTAMSEVAGRMAVQQGAKYLEMPQGGNGILLGGVPGVEPATVLIVGAGTVGKQAARMACGLDAKVYLLDTNMERLRYLSDIMPKNCTMIMSKPKIIRRIVKKADLVIGAVLLPGARAPKILSRDALKTMKPGAVLVDVAIDQGGCFETSRPTTHRNPTYIKDGIVHYCVTNMPGAVPRTSTVALTNSTLSFVLELANKGWKKAFIESEKIRHGANIVEGKITCRGVAEAFGLDYTSIGQVLHS